MDLFRSKKERNIFPCATFLNVQFQISWRVDIKLSNAHASDARASSAHGSDAHALNALASNTHAPDAYTKSHLRMLHSFFFIFILLKSF